MLLPVRSVAQRHEGAWGNYRLHGDRYPMTANEPNGTVIVYYLQSPPASVSLTVSDAEGRVVRKLNAPAKAGVNRAVWDLEKVAPGEYTITLEAGRSVTKKAKVGQALPPAQ